jgi:curved DNA-binding protein CbpA
MTDTAPESERPIADLVREKHAQLAGGDYFALLGVSRDADPTAIKAAYFGLAKLLHPDMIARLNLAELEKPAVEVFKGLSEAYATLIDRRRRVEYMARTADGKALPTAQEKVQRDAASEARIYFHKGTLMLQRRVHAEAEACFRKAVELDPKNSKFMVNLGWAIMNNDAKPLEPRLEESRQWIERALESPNQDASGDPYYYMALYYKARGDAVRQRSFLQDCLSINNRHVDALREQRLLAMRARKRPESPLMKQIQAFIDKYKKK